MTDTPGTKAGDTPRTPALPKLHRQAPKRSLTCVSPPPLPEPTLGVSPPLLEPTLGSHSQLHSMPPLKRRRSSCGTDGLDAVACSPATRQPRVRVAANHSGASEQVTRLWQAVAPLLVSSREQTDEGAGASSETIPSPRRLVPQVQLAMERQSALQKWAESESRLRQRLAEELHTLKGSVRVLCRIRPQSTTCAQRNEDPAAAMVAPTSVCVDVPVAAKASGKKRVCSNRSYTFDRVFDGSASQVCA